jgi:hypothetical protein
MLRIADHIRSFSNNLSTLFWATDALAVAVRDQLLSVSISNARRQRAIIRGIPDGHLGPLGSPTTSRHHINADYPGKWDVS